MRLPASENSRSLDTEVAGIARYLRANLASFEKFCERIVIVCHKSFRDRNDKDESR